MFKGWTLASLTLLVWIVAANSAHAADAAKGAELFTNNCARCHSAKMEKPSTGPALMGASARIPRGDWRYEWVKNSDKVIKSGEPYAVKIYKENNQAPMQAMPHLTNEDIDNIFAYIDAYVPPVPVETAGGAGIDPSKDAALSGLWNWIRLLIFVIVVLLAGIAMQMARMRGIEFLAGVDFDKLNARLFLGFFILGMIGSVYMIQIFQPYYIQFNSASVHGEQIDQMFWITMAVVMAVFVLVNGVLFYFAWKYGSEGDRKAKYYPENHKLEMIWTVVPAIVLTVLVIFGIRTWTAVMTPPEAGTPVLNVEVSGQQWGWMLRYAGDDKKFGDVDVRRIGGDNILGVDPNDPATKDDFMSDELVLCEDMVVDLKIRSRDVLHSVFLPHFRVKMDAVPGMDTRFHFIPRHTTQEFRDYLKDNAYWGQIDTIITKTIEPDSNAAPGAKAIVVTDTIRKADKFDYELACAEVCGRGHFSMRKKVVVLKKEDYLVWYEKNKQTTMLSTMSVTPAATDAQLSSSVKPGEILDK